MRTGAHRARAGHRHLTQGSANSFLLLVVVASGIAGYVVAENSDAAEPKPVTTGANADTAAPKPVTTGADGGSGGGGAGAGGTRLAALNQIPAGGGLILKSANVVLTRNAAGKVLGFSATCTHQGCTVSSVQNGTINCPCHDSRFDVRTGAPIDGKQPASRPLPPVPVVVRDGAVFTA